MKRRANKRVSAKDIDRSAKVDAVFLEDRQAFPFVPFETAKEGVFHFAALGPKFLPMPP